MNTNQTGGSRKIWKRITTIRVMVVDDHAVVRSGLRAFLSTFEEFQFVGEAENGLEALRLTRKFSPDVIVMDLLMPEMDGPTAIRLIRQQHPAIQIVVLTSYHDGGLVQEALQAGAVSYLLKNVAADELARAIRAACQGRAILSPEAAEALKCTASRPEPPELTEREREVLVLMARGLSNAEIAARLVVCPSTVKFHVSNILSKMKAASRTEAVALALQQRLPGSARCGDGCIPDETRWRLVGEYARVWRAG